MERIVNGKKVSLRLFVNDKLKPLYTKHAQNYYVVYMQIVYDSMNTKLKVVNFENPLLPPIAAMKNENLHDKSSEVGSLLERLSKLYLDVIQLEIEENQDSFELKNISNALFSYLKDYKTLLWEKTSVSLMDFLGDHLIHNEWIRLKESSLDHFGIFEWLESNRPKLLNILPDIFQFVRSYKSFLSSTFFERVSLLDLIHNLTAQKKFGEAYSQFLMQNVASKPLEVDLALNKCRQLGLFLKNS